MINGESKEDSSNRLSELLSSFSCQNDTDIESFLHNRAVEFEFLSKARTYLVCDEEVLDKEGHLEILGYFSLSLKTLSIPDGVSNRKRKELDGFNAKMHGEPIREVPCYLIGQFGKNSAIPKGKQILSGDELMEFAVTVVMSAVGAVGGRYVMVECHDKKVLLDFYNRNGFDEIARVPYAGIPMVQLIRKLVDA